MSIYTDEGPEFISLHTPKCAGTSLKISLREALGKRCMLDYGDRIIDMSEDAKLIRKKRKIHLLQNLNAFGNTTIIHGHFYLAKYIDVFPDSKFVTILRRPDHLLFSYYKYLLSRTDENYLIKQAKGCSDFEEFISLTEFQNIITKLLYPLDVKDFFYIGFYEDYRKSLLRYSEFLNVTLNEVQSNVGKNKESDVKKTVLEKILTYNRNDFEFYFRALKAFGGNDLCLQM